MSSSGLIVRRSERFEISLPGRVRVAAHHAEAMHFAKGVSGPDRWINVDVIDFASGGLGFIALVFMPRNLDLEVEILNFQGDTEDAALRCIMRIKRVQMTDRRPAYQIGCSIIDVDHETQTQIDALIDRLRGLADQEMGDQGDDDDA